MKLEEINTSEEDAWSFVESSDLSGLHNRDKKFWVSFLIYNSVAAKKIYAFLRNAAFENWNKLPNIEKERDIWLTFAASKNINPWPWGTLYRVTPIPRGVTWTVGQKIVYENKHVSYWSQTKSWALNFVDEDTATALIFTEQNNDNILFDLNLLPFPGGNLSNHREDEIIYRPGKIEATVIKLFNLDE